MGTLSPASHHPVTVCVKDNSSRLVSFLFFSAFALVSNEHDSLHLGRRSSLALLPPCASGCYVTCCHVALHYTYSLSATIFNLIFGLFH